jgi:hypothetical protein
LVLDALWANLTGKDARVAFRAVWTLSEDPRAADLLRKKLPPVPRPEETRLVKLIADLDSGSFQIRAAASSALADLGELAAPSLEKALREANSLEMRQRISGLLARLTKGVSPAQVVQVRAVHVLELSGGPEARQVLQAWAQGAPGAFLTREAQAALARLQRDRKSGPAG